MTASSAAPLQRRYGGPNGYGHVCDPEGHQRTHVRVLLQRVGVDHTATPDAVSHRKYGPGVFNQGPTSSCTGHSVSGACATTLGKEASAPQVPRSPDWLYKIGRCLDRHAGADGKRPELADDGAMPNQVMRGMNEYGVPPIGPRRADGRYSDADEQTVLEEPTLSDFEAAADFELVGQYEIPTWDPAFVQLVRAAIAAGFCVCFSIYADTKGPRSVEEWDPSTGPLGAVATPGDDKGGRHYVYADGYHTAPDRTTVVEWVNSWGEDWGVGGYGEGDEAFMRGWGNVVVMRVRKVNQVQAAA